MSNNQAGKGDKPRPTNKKMFDENFDSIKWSSIKRDTTSVKKNKKTYKY